MLNQVYLSIQRINGIVYYSKKKFETKTVFYNILNNVDKNQPISINIE